jgi:hypothetical protein
MTVPLARAQSQAGGVPSLAQQVQTLQTQVQTLITANSTLQTTVTTMQTTIVNLQNNNTSLQAALNAEITARTAADSTETAARKQADSDLLNGLLFVENLLLNNEANLKSDLQSQIDGLKNTVNASAIGNVYVGAGAVSPDLNNNAPTVIASVHVPAGSYAIHAVVPAHNYDGDEQSGGCALNTAFPAPFTGWSSAAEANVYLMPENRGEQLAVLDAQTFATDTTITLSCTGYKWQTVYPKIVAVRVRSIN